MKKQFVGKPLVPIGRYPIGTVVAYGGKMDQDAWHAAGWLYCDGNAISRTDYNDLFAVIKILHGQGDGETTFNLPDYRGRFLRGMSDGTNRDPDAASRVAPNPGGSIGDAIGSIQPQALAAPIIPFTTTTDGEHLHSVDHVPNDNDWYAIAGSSMAQWNGTASTHAGGQHPHSIKDIGGDKESRPLNAYVVYLIKFKD